LQDLTYHRDRGSHKSSSKHLSKLDSIISEEISRDFALPLPIDILFKIPNATLAPLGCHQQETINEQGERIPKYRITHDQSFPGPSGHSVNSRVIRESLPPCMYSFVLSRTIHYIMNLRRRYPSTRIFLYKFDLDTAYKRCHVLAATAAESLTIFDGLLLMALRMTFGGTPRPLLWGYISDTVADVTNARIHNAFWDHSSLFDEISDSLDAPRSMDDDVPFHPAKPLAVNIPTNDVGKVDIYIDDSIVVALDLDNNPCRVSRAIPLAIQAITRSTDPLDPVSRKDIIS